MELLNCQSRSAGNLAILNKFLSLQQNEDTLPPYLSFLQPNVEKIEGFPSTLQPNLEELRDNFEELGGNFEELLKLIECN